jgi:hypothetical protein
MVKKQWMNTNPDQIFSNHHVSLTITCVRTLIFVIVTQYRDVIPYKNMFLSTSEKLTKILFLRNVLQDDRKQ